MLIADSNMCMYTDDTTSARIYIFGLSDFRLVGLEWKFKLIVELKLQRSPQNQFDSIQYIPTEIRLKQSSFKKNILDFLGTDTGLL